MKDKQYKHEWRWLMMYMYDIICKPVPVMKIDEILLT